MTRSAPADRPGAALSHGQAGHRRLRAWGAILAAIAHGWRQRTSRPLLALLLLVLVGLPVAVVWLRGTEPALKVLTAELSVLLMAAWGGLVYGLVVQNTAVAAQLVPGHVQRLRELLALGWCGTLALVAGVALARGASPLFPTIAIALVMLAVALTVRWPWLVLVVWAVPALTVRLFGSAIQWLAESLGAGFAPAMLLAALLVAWLLGGLVGTGGAGHLRRQARLAAWRRTANEGGPMPNDAGALWNWLARASASPYHAALERLSRRPGVPVWPRLMLVFGPSTDWRVHASWAGGVAALGGLAVGWLWLTGTFDGDALRPVQVVGPALGLASMALNPVTSLMMASARTRREQALVALLPGVPRGAALNRGLARRQVLYFAAAWLGVAALEAALAALAAPALLPALMAGLVGLWPMAALFFFDMSRLPAQPNARLGRVMATFFGGPVLALGAHLGLGWSLASVALVSGLFTATLLAWGWQRLGRLPSALPACRLA